MRQIVLDTETTGLEVSQGHRIIEIGCVEVINRRLTGNHYHVYINPEREVDQGAIEVHGITNEFLADKPLFAQVAEDFLAFVTGAELVIHNAPFDVGFLNAELQRLDAGLPNVDTVCGIVDSLVMARRKHPGQRNTLDALCVRYDVDNSSRELHGALLDAEILADVYLMMTGGQTSLSLSDSGSPDDSSESSGDSLRRLPSDRPPLPVLEASAAELRAHEALLDAIADAGGEPVWRKLGIG
jgi:DNA polymerase III subunit epsilon